MHFCSAVFRPKCATSDSVQIWCTNAVQKGYKLDRGIKKFRGRSPDYFSPDNPRFPNLILIPGLRLYLKCTANMHRHPTELPVALLGCICPPGLCTGNVPFYRCIIPMFSGTTKMSAKQSPKSKSKRSGIKLVSMGKSARKGKKYKAVFLMPNGRQKTVHFGGAGNRDFTLINKKGSKWYLPTMAERKEIRRRYIERHSRGNENWNDPTTAGALSRWILWEKPTFEGSLRFYLKKFGIKRSRQ